MKITERKVFLLLLMMCFLQSVSGHGRLLEPPSRSSMWRFGFNTPKNLDDQGLYCGGYTVQWNENGGKCGICGDGWNLPSPRPNEIGGEYGKGIIVKTYKPGQVISTIVELTANHKGHFQFRVCPAKNNKEEVTQECLDQNTLKIVNSSDTKYFVGKHGTSKVTLAVELPKGLTCKRCVFQWTYTAGNNWGMCENGKGALGCGPQETFKACSDIAITDS